jgi:hypothetical protein
MLAKAANLRWPAQFRKTLCQNKWRVFKRLLKPELSCRMVFHARIVHEKAVGSKADCKLPFVVAQFRKAHNRASLCSPERLCQPQLSSFAVHLHSCTELFSGDVLEPCVRPRSLCSSV